MAAVEIMLRTILWAVPAFMREDPARTSGPTWVTMAKWAARSSGELRIAGERDGLGAAPAGFVDGGDGEGSASAGCDAQDYVFFGGLAAGHFFAAGCGVVFAGFGFGG